MASVASQQYILWNDAIFLHHSIILSRIEWPEWHVSDRLDIIRKMTIVTN